MGSRLVIHSTSTQWPYQPLPWEYALLSTIPFPRLIKCWRGFKSTLRVLFEDMAFVNSLLRMKLAFRCETNTRDPEAYGPWHLAASGRIVLRFYVRKRKGKGSMYGTAIRPLHATFLRRSFQRIFFDEMELLFFWEIIQKRWSLKWKTHSRV